MSKELIRLRDLCMAFDDELVLDHINLYINDSDAADHWRLHDAHVGRRHL